MPTQHAQLTWWANALGLTGSPFDSFLTLRGLRTLDARLRVHEENTHALVELLDGHAGSERVALPGTGTAHPGHAIAAKQQHGFGAMLSVELDGGVDAVRAFLDGLQCFTLAESLGGVESLIAHPATMTHAAMSPEARAAAGIGDGLLRLSVGIEHADDLRGRHRRCAGTRRGRQQQRQTRSEMNAAADAVGSRARFRVRRTMQRTAAAPARIALLGTGTVGSAVLARLASWNETPLGERLKLVHVANSRVAIGDRNRPPREAGTHAVRSALRARARRICTHRRRRSAIAVRGSSSMPPPAKPSPSGTRTGWRRAFTS